MMQIFVSTTTQLVSSFVAFTLNVLKFRTLFTICFQRKCGNGAGIHKMLVRKANRADPDQTASSEAV